MLTGRDNLDLATIAPDEPVFVIRAKDRCAVATLKAYVAEATRHGASPALIQSVMEHGERMVDYQQIHGTKVPDL